MRTLLLGLDIGTTGAKATLFDERGEIEGYAFEEYGIICARPGRAEQDAAAIWAVAREVIARAIGAKGRDVRAIACSVQGDAVIPLDRHGAPLANAQLGMDYRGAEVCEALCQTIGGARLFHLTGMPPHPLNAFVKMLWILRSDPALYKRTYKFATYSDYMMKMLGSDGFVVDRTMASRTMCMRTQTGEWCDEILSAAGFEREKLSRPVDSGRVVGRILPELAQRLGLNPDCLIVAGGHDQTCAALGAGVTEPGLALDSHGTAEVISTAMPSFETGAILRSSYYPCYRHAVDGRYFTFALNHTGGIALKWFVENFCAGEDYAAVFARMPEGPTGILVLPHFSGSGTPSCALDARAVFSGMSLSSTRYDLAKAILEGLACEMRINMERFERAGLPVRALRCVGGGAKSPAGLRLKADVLGVAISTLKVREAACLGAAILAGAGAGIFSGAADAGKRLARTEQTYYPDPARRKSYDGQYQRYLALYGYNTRGPARASDETPS